MTGHIEESPSSGEQIPSELLDDRYRLQATIGRGGMGTVYRALDTRLGRTVAIKVLREADGDETRFAAEVRTLARFSHPNLVRIFDAGELEGKPYLVMELIEGTTLSRRLLDGPLPEREVVQIGSGIAAALAHAHSEGIVHRDVKPANVLLDQHGTPYLADFGIARLVDTTGITATGLMLGTPAYLAPEQIQGTEVGPPADVYALGLMLLECLTGRRSFEGTASEITAARLHRDPEVPAALDPNWHSLLAAMTIRNPELRIPAAMVSTRLADRLARPSIDPSMTALIASSDLPTSRVPSLEQPTQTLVVDGGAGEGETTIVAGGTPPSVRPSRKALLALLAVLALIGVVVGIALASSPSPRNVGTTSTTTAPTTSTTTTTTTSTTVPTTSTTVPTTTVPLPSVAGAVASFQSVVNSGAASGAIDSDAANHLVADAESVTSASAQGASSASAPFAKLSNDLAQYVNDGSISDSATVQSLVSATGAIASALGVPNSVTLTPTTVPPGPGDGHGKGHGH